MTTSRPQLHLTSITSTTSTPSAAFTRALASRAAYAAAVADLRAQGVTKLQCPDPDCGFKHEISMVGRTCNAHTHEGVCTSTAPLIPVLPTLSLSNGLGQRVEVRYSTRGVRL